MSCDLFVFAGEASADLHGENLLHELKTLHPDLKIAGVGGPRMRQCGMDCILPMEAFQVMGFVDVFLCLPKLIKQFYQVIRAIEKLQPKVVLTIDYPGFNLRLVRKLRKRGYVGKLCHYICPSVWAWGKRRIPLMAKNLDLLLTILPFEKEIFKETSLPVAYVGHPLVERLKNHVYSPFSLPDNKRIIALFPGSRQKEIERNLPNFLNIVRSLSEEYCIVVSVADPFSKPKIFQMISAAGLTPGKEVHFVASQFTYELMHAAYLAIAKSGTVTLELALHRTPTVVTYAISPLDLFIARDLLRIRLPYYSLPNIIAKKAIFPELFGPNFTLENLKKHVQELLTDVGHQAYKQRCDEVISLLGDQSASKQAAQHINKILGSKA